MQFFKKKFLIALLNNAELRIVLYEESSGKAKRISSDTIEFPSEVVKDSAIISFSLFYERLAEFLKTKSELEGIRLILAIPEEKMYIKGLELDLGDWERKNELVKNFEKGIPFKEDDLILRERLIGRVLELSAVSRQFIEDFKRPFADFHMDVIGVISIPQAAAIVFKPKERSFLLASCDNDFVMMLAENSSIISSGTKRMSRIKGSDAVKAFERFVKFTVAEHIKGVSIIMSDDSSAADLKTELENSHYQIKEMKNTDILDLIASYYSLHKSEEKDWNMLYAESVTSHNRTASKNLKIVSALFVLLISLSVLIWFSVKFIRQKYEPYPLVSDSAIIENPAIGATPTLAQSGIQSPIKKENFPVKIFNGTAISGEAGRLKAILMGRGFSVSEIGNMANQNQAVTKLQFSPDIPDNVISEIRDLLDSRYQNVLQSNLSSVERGITIIVGRKK